ncbi:MAG: DUF371 domain-containing protein [Pyrobaculum sp.]
MSCIDAVFRQEALHTVFTARGHPNVTAKNRQTLEITKDPYVTKRGDCIVACCAEKAAGELGEELLHALARPGRVALIIDTGSVWDYVEGLTPLTAPTSTWRIVARRSAYVDSSTVAIAINKAAAGLRRELVKILKEGAPVRITIGICPPR